MKPSLLISMLLVAAFSITACGETKKINMQDSTTETITMQPDSDKPSATHTPMPTIDPAYIEEYGDLLAPFHLIKDQRSIEIYDGAKKITVDYDYRTSVQSRDTATVYHYKPISELEDPKALLTTAYLGDGPYYCNGCHKNKGYWNELIDHYNEILTSKKKQLDELQKAEPMTHKIELDIEDLKSDIDIYENLIIDTEKQMEGVSDDAPVIIDSFDHTSIYTPADNGNDKVTITFNDEYVAGADFSDCIVTGYTFNENIQAKDILVHEKIINELLDKANLWNITLTKAGSLTKENGQTCVYYNISPMQKGDYHIIPSFYEFTIFDDQIEFQLHNPLIFIDKTENVTLLSYDEIKNIADMLFSENASNFEAYVSKGILGISDVKLEPRIDADSESLVPAWNFYPRTAPNEWLKGVAILSINAIDGSLVYLYNEEDFGQSYIPN